MTQAPNGPNPDVIIRKRSLKCKVCTLWRPRREDSVADDFGVCPRRVYPDNLTSSEDGCADGVPPAE